MLEPIPDQWISGLSENPEGGSARFDARYELGRSIGDPQPSRSHSAPGAVLVEPRHVSDVPSSLLGRLGAQPRGYESPGLAGHRSNGGQSPLWSGMFGGESREHNGERAWGNVGGGGARVFGEGGVANGEASQVPFECRPCNREYKTIEAYQAHLQSHRKVFFSHPLSLSIAFILLMLVLSFPQCQHCDFEAIPRCLRDHELVGHVTLFFCHVEVM